MFPGVTVVAFTSPPAVNTYVPFPVTPTTSTIFAASSGVNCAFLVMTPACVTSYDLFFLSAPKVTSKPSSSPCVTLSGFGFPLSISSFNSSGVIIILFVDVAESFITSLLWASKTSSFGSLFNATFMPLSFAPTCFWIFKAFIAKDIASFSSAISVSSFALFPCVKTPLLPVSIAIETPAKINKIMIVTTNAINVIPFVFFNFFLK